MQIKNIKTKCVKLTLKEFARPKSIKERMVDKQKRVETQKKQTVMKHVSMLWSSIFVTLVAKKISLSGYTAILASCGVA